MHSVTWTNISALQMARLEDEDLTTGTLVKGIIPDGTAELVSVKWHGSDVPEVVYKDSAGRVSTEILFRENLLCIARIEKLIRGEEIQAKLKDTDWDLIIGPEAREIQNDLLEKYATDGELQFTLPDVLKVTPISQHGNVNEIIGKFGGADQLRNAVKQLQTLSYTE